MNILEAETDFSGLLRLLESGREDCVTFLRNGRPVVKMTLINEAPVSKRIGAGKGKFNLNGDFDADNREIADMLMEGLL